MWWWVSVCQSPSVCPVEAQEERVAHLCFFKPITAIPNCNLYLYPFLFNWSVCLFLLSPTNILVFYFSFRHLFPFFSLRRTGWLHCLNVPVPLNVSLCNANTLPSFTCLGCYGRAVSPLHPNAMIVDTRNSWQGKGAPVFFLLRWMRGSFCV